jgi:hypothetical protein
VELAQRIIVSWRDIPSQVIVKAGRRDQAKVLLSQRFQDAIDRAAMRGKARDADSYLEEWRKAPPEECGDDLEAEAQAAAARIEAAYDDVRLRALVKSGGVEDKSSP